MKIIEKIYRFIVAGLFLLMPFYLLFLILFGYGAN